MNFKLKVVSAAAVLAFGVAHQAHALTIVGNSTTTLATEQLPTVGTVTLNNIGVSATSQGVVAGNSYSIRVRLLGGGTFASAVAAGTLQQIDQSSNAPYATEVFTPTLVSPSEARYTINGVAGVTTSPANTIWRLNGATVTGAAASLITSGINDNGCGFTTGQISVDARYFNSNDVEVDLPVGLGNQGVVITAAQGITGAITPPTTNPILDVLTAARPAAAPAASKFLQTNANGTRTNVLSAPIGTFKFSDVLGIQGQSTAPGTDYNLAAATDAGATVGVTASAGFGVGSTLYVIDDTANTACSADATATTPITAGTAIAGTVSTPTGLPNQRLITFAAGNLNLPANRGKTYTICYQLTGTTGNVPTSTFTGYAEEDRSGTDVSDFAAGPTCRATLARATINGGVIAVRNYSPAAANAFGWNQQIRIINAGSVATPITAYFQYFDGTTSTPRDIVLAPIQPGGSVTLTNTAIEALMGVAPPLTASNPRLILVGATDRLRVQNYIVQPGGNWVEASGGQDDGDGPAGTNN